jgi:hypothetical protein
MRTWRFLQIGFGTERVKATFYVICPECSGDLSIGDSEDELELATEMAHAKSNSDMMQGKRGGSMRAHRMAR